MVALADGYGRLAAQYTYHPYGKVRSAELMANPSTGPPSSVVESINSDAISVTYWPRVLAAARSNRLGHQGLPVERLDASGPWSDPMGTDGTVPWNGVTNTALLGGLPPSEYTAAYHSRNRLYLPDWGRFSSSDPNGTGLPVLDSLTFGGMGLSASSINPDYQSHYGDGMNTHAAYGGNPLSGSDPLGLYTNWSNYSGAWDGGGGGSWDPFDMVDDYLAEDLGSKAAFMERVIGGVHTAAYVTTWVASWAPGPLGIAAGLANGAMGAPGPLQGTMAQSVMNYADYGGMIFSLGRLGARFSNALWSSGVRYASQFGTPARLGLSTSSGISHNIASLGQYAQHVGKVLPYGEAKALTQGANHAVEAHKLLEKRHILNGSIQGNINDVPAVVLTKDQHSTVTTALREALPYGRTYTPGEIRAAYEQVYTALGRSEWLPHISRYFP